MIFFIDFNISLNILFIYSLKISAEEDPMMNKKRDYSQRETKYWR